MLADLMWAVYLYPGLFLALFILGAALTTFGLVVIGRSDRD